MLRKCQVRQENKSRMTLWVIRSKSTKQDKNKDKVSFLLSTGDLGHTRLTSS